MFLEKDDEDRVHFTSLIFLSCKIKNIIYYLELFEQEKNYLKILHLAIVEVKKNKKRQNEGLDSSVYAFNSFLRLRPYKDIFSFNFISSQSKL